MKLPKSETAWVSYYDCANKLTHILTSRQYAPETFILYKVDGDVLKKLGQSRDPKSLEEKYSVFPKKS